MRRLLETHRENTDKLTPERAVSQISAAKASGLSPRQYALSKKSALATLYHEYQAVLMDENALDFDDILLCGTKLVRTHPDTVQHVEHVLVDEFQDTNRTQYELMKYLAAAGSVTIVGDPDQSIYGWRCADSGNLARMSRDYTNTAVVFLEQNFRSCRAVLESALRVVRQDTTRINKGLYTEHGKGSPVTFRRFDYADDEAEFAALEIQRLLTSLAPALSPLDIAVLFRSNSQSRVFESAFQQHRIPYRIVGAARFFERAEVKDLLAYLLLVDNPAYTTGLVRIANVPRRGIGAKTLEDLRTLAAAKKEPLIAVLENIADRTPGAPTLRSTAMPGIVSLVRTLRTVRRAASEGMASADLLRLLISELDYGAHLRRGDDYDARWDNVQELINFAAAIDKDSEAEAASPLRALLETGTLSSEEQTDNTPKVTLSTCHGAKGLEWPVVFVVAAEDGSMPLYRATTPEEVREERRLLYVAMTRAATNLYISCAARRMIAGSVHSCALSPFLQPLVPHAHGGTSATSEWSFQAPVLTETLTALGCVLGRNMPPASEVERRETDFRRSRHGARHAQLCGRGGPPERAPETRGSSGFVSAINTVSAKALHAPSQKGSFGTFSRGSSALGTAKSGGILGAFRDGNAGAIASGTSATKRPAASSDVPQKTALSPALGAKKELGGGANQQARRPRLGVGRARRLN